MHTEWVQDMGALLVRTVSRTLGLETQRLAQSPAVHAFVDRHVSLFEQSPEWMQLVGLLLTKKCNQYLASSTGTHPLHPEETIDSVERMLAAWTTAGAQMMIPPGTVPHPADLHRIFMSLDSSETSSPVATVVDPTHNDTVPVPGGAPSDAEIVDTPVLVGDNNETTPSILPVASSTVAIEEDITPAVVVEDSPPATTAPSSKKKSSRGRKRRASTEDPAATSSSSSSDESSSASAADMVETPVKTETDETPSPSSSCGATTTTSPPAKKKKKTTKTKTTPPPTVDATTAPAASEDTTAVVSSDPSV